jgi:hypothetical protein
MKTAWDFNFLSLNIDTIWGRVFDVILQNFDSAGTTFMRNITLPVAWSLMSMVW